jgi:hypothetical protein
MQANRAGGICTPSWSHARNRAWQTTATRRNGVMQPKRRADRKAQLQVMSACQIQSDICWLIRVRGSGWRWNRLTADSCELASRVSI